MEIPLLNLGKRVTRMKRFSQEIGKPITAPGFGLSSPTNSPRAPNYVSAEEEFLKRGSISFEANIRDGDTFHFDGDKLSLLVDRSQDKILYQSLRKLESLFPFANSEVLVLTVSSMMGGFQIDDDLFNLIFQKTLEQKEEPHVLIGGLRFGMTSVEFRPHPEQANKGIVPFYSSI